MRWTITITVESDEGVDVTDAAYDAAYGYLVANGDMEIIDVNVEGSDG